jgi:hypothetical protein
VAQLSTVFDDLVVRDLEEKYRYAVVKILLNNHGSDGWTGFVVHNNPHIFFIPTVIDMLKEKYAYHLRWQILHAAMFAVGYIATNNFIAGMVCI